MGTAELFDLAKGFGASAPIIVLLLYLLLSERKRADRLQEDNISMLKETVALGVLLKALLERVIVKIGA